MFLAGTRKRVKTPGNATSNPFLGGGGTAASGPGVASAQGAELFTGALMRRRRWAAHALGDTPQRDGPFSAGAQSMAVNFPPKARQEVRKKEHGLNPFDAPA